MRFIENLERREVKRAVIAFGNAFLRLFDARYISPIIWDCFGVRPGSVILHLNILKGVDLIMLWVEWQATVMTKST